MQPRLPQFQDDYAAIPGATGAFGMRAQIEGLAGIVFTAIADEDDFHPRVRCPLFERRNALRWSWE